MDAVHQFTGDALKAQFLGHGDVECHGQIALVCDEPAGDVLADDLDVGEFNFGLLAVKVNGEFAVFLKLGDLGL